MRNKEYKYNHSNRPRHFDSSENLCKYISKYQNKHCFIFFSLGIDSLAMYLQLIKYFKKIVPIYMYIIPDLEFVNNAIGYYEQKFNRKIIKIPHPATVSLIHNGYLQEQMTKTNKDYFGNYDMDTCTMAVAESIGYPTNLMAGIGLRMDDNPTRRMMLTKTGVANYTRSVFYPIYDFTQKNVIDIIKENHIKIPIDYQIFGRSFDGVMFRFSSRIKEHFPNDYDKLKHYFPLIDIEVNKWSLHNEQ